MIKYVLKNYSFKSLITVIFDEYIWSIFKHIPGVEGIFLRRLYLKIFSNSCNMNVTLQRNIHIRNSNKINFGNNIYINRDCHIDAYGGIDFGDNVGIGPKTVIITNDHSFITQGNNYYERKFIPRKVTIGNNTIIGSNCYLNPGITIGENCIIASGTNVFVDIPDNTKVSSSYLDKYTHNMKKSIKNLKYIDV